MYKQRNNHTDSDIFLIDCLRSFIPFRSDQRQPKPNQTEPNQLRPDQGDSIDSSIEWTKCTLCIPIHNSNRS